MGVAGPKNPLAATPLLAGEPEGEFVLEGRVCLLFFFFSAVDPLVLVLRLVKAEGGTGLLRDTPGEETEAAVADDDDPELVDVEWW